MLPLDVISIAAGVVAGTGVVAAGDVAAGVAAAGAGAGAAAAAGVAAAEVRAESIGMGRWWSTIVCAVRICASRVAHGIQRNETKNMNK